MNKAEYKYLNSFKSMSDFYIVLEEAGCSDGEIEMVGTELLERGEASTEIVSYKLVGYDLFAARKSNMVGTLD